MGKITNHGEPMRLWRNQITIWSRVDGTSMSLQDLAYEAEEGNAICTSETSVEVTDYDEVEDAVRSFYVLDEPAPDDEWQVMGPGEWENEDGPKDWWAVSNNDGIVAYFGTEKLACDYQLSMRGGK